MSGTILLCGFALFLCVALRPLAVSGADDPAPLGVVSPAKGDQWCVGSKHYVLWNAAKDAANRAVRVEYSTDGGQTWAVINANAPNDGTLLWQVPNKLSAQCHVRVADARSAVFSIVASQEVRDYQWVNATTKAPWAPRDGAGALVYKDKMWLVGGWNPGDKVNFPRICNNEMWSSEDGAEWKLVKPNTFKDAKFDPTADWEGRHTAGYVVYKDAMWIIGGDVNQGHYHFDVWKSTDGATWTYVNKGKNVPWGPRALHYTLVHDGKIWVIGGQTLPNFAVGAETIFYDDIWTTTDGVNWTKVTPKGPHWSHRGMIGGNAVFQNRMWILGGGTYDTPQFPERKFFNDVWSSADGVQWTQHVQHAPWHPRQYHDVAMFDERLWVLEGWNKGNRNDVWYSADGVNWYELPDTLWAPRHAASPFVFKGCLWMAAGNNMEHDVWKLQRSGSQGR